MKWLFVSLLLVHTLPAIFGVHKKVKILFPMPVQHIHHTKVVKVPEYHHYFHDRKRPNQKHYGHSENDFEHYNEKDPALYETDAVDSNYFSQASYNDFDYYPEQHQNFHDRRHTPPLPPKPQGGAKRHVQYGAIGSHNHNRQRNPYEPQHFYHKY